MSQPVHNLKFAATKRYDQITMADMGYTAPDAAQKMPIFQDVYFPHQNKLKNIETSLAFQQKQIQARMLVTLTELARQQSVIPELAPIFQDLTIKATGINQALYTEIALGQIQKAQTLIQTAQQQGKITPEQAGAMTQPLQQLQADWQFLNLLHSHGCLQADGLIRYNPLVLSPTALLKDQQAKWETPIADVAIIGGGPAGLSMGIHATHYGLKNVLFEAGHVGQSFSDALAQPVHKMRTSAGLSSLVFGIALSKEKGEEPPALADEFNFNYGEKAKDKLRHYRAQAIAARKNITATVGRDFKTTPITAEEFAEFDNADILNNQKYQPSTQGGFARAEFFQHIDDVANKLQQPKNGTVTDNSTLTEQAPIQSVQKLTAQDLQNPDGIITKYQKLLPPDEYNQLAAQLKMALPKEKELYLITGRKGHVQLARKLVVSTGLVGEAGENGRQPQVFKTLMTQNSKTTLGLWGQADMLNNREDMLTNLNALIQKQSLPKQVFTKETQLGHPDMRKTIALLPAGTRCAVIGSGESAAKSVMELFNLNPNIKVDLYTSQELEPSPYQIPFNHGKYARPAIYNQKRADEFREHMERNFGTPITDPTFADLQHEQNVTKRLRVINLKKHFDQNTVVLKPTTGKLPGFQVYRTYNRVITFLFNTIPGLSKLWKPTSKINGVVVSAGGYDRASGKKSPLFQDLLAKNLLALKPSTWFRKNKFAEVALNQENRLTSGRDSSLYLSGQANGGLNTDTTIFGSAFRNYEITQHIRDGFNGREMLCFNSDSRFLQQPQLEAMLRLAIFQTTDLSEKNLYSTIQKITQENDMPPDTVVYGALRLSSTGQVLNSVNNINPTQKLSNLQDVEKLVKKQLGPFLSVPGFPSDTDIPPPQALYYSAFRQNLLNGQQILLFLGSRYAPNSRITPSDYEGNVPLPEEAEESSKD